MRSCFRREANRIARTRESNRSQSFFHQFESQIVPLGNAEPRIAIRKRFENSCAAIAAAFVPGDQLVADGNHRHFHFYTFPLIVRETFGFGKHAPADAASLQSRAHGKHAEIAGVALLFDVAASEQFAIGTFGKYHDTVGFEDDVRYARNIDALTVEKIRLGRPTASADVAAI